MARVTPFTDAAKLLVSATFGDPNLRAEQALGASKEDRNRAAAEASRAAASASEAQAQRRIFDRDALAALTPEKFDLGAAIQNIPGGNVPQIFGEQLEPNEAGPPSPFSLPTQSQVQTRGADLASLLARTGGLNAGNFGDILQSFEGINANIGVEDPDARLRSAAAGAGNPFSTDQLEAQDLATQRTAPERADLSELLSLADVTTKNVRTPTGEIRQAIGPKLLGADGNTDEFIQPGSGLFSALSQAETPGIATGQTDPLTKSTRTGLQKEVISGQGGAADLMEAIQLLEQEQLDIASGKVNVPTGSLRGQIIAPGTSDNKILNKANQVFDIARAIPGFADFVEGRTQASPEEVRRIRETRLTVEAATRTAARRIANGSDTGQFTKADAADASKAMQLIDIGGDNKSLLGQLRVLLSIVERGTSLRKDILGGGVNIGGGGDIADEDLDAVEAELNRKLGITQ